MKQANYDNFPGGNLSYSLKIDENKLNQRFSWILSMFRHFENKMKLFEDRLSLSNFQNTVNPVIFQRTFEKINKQSLNKMHQERSKVYWELYNGLSKDITQKFTASVLLQQQKRLEETRALILGNITASSQALDKLSEQSNRTKNKLVQISRTLQYCEKQLNYPEQKVLPIFISEVSVQTIQETKQQNSKKTQYISCNNQISDMVQQKVAVKVDQISQRLQFINTLLNKKCDNILLMVSAQDQKFRQYFQQSQQQYSIEKNMLVTSNRSMSPSIRKRSTIFEQQNNIEIDRLRQQINFVRDKIQETIQVKMNDFYELKQKVVSIQQIINRDLEDINQQRWIKQKVSNYLQQMFQSPFEQKFSKTLNDTINNKMVDIKFDLKSYIKLVDKKLQQRVSKTELKNIQILIDEKILLLEHLIKNKEQTQQINSNNHKITSRVDLTPPKIYLKTQIKSHSKQSILSHRQTRTQSILKRPTTNKRISAKTLSQSFHLASYGKRFF